MKCVYCNHPYTYALANDQRKCGRCRRKFSVAKLRRKTVLWQAFVLQTPASQAAQTHQMHVATVLKHYERFRRAVVFDCQAQYETYGSDVNDYDEYLYLPKTLDPQKEIHKAKHFLTLAYRGKVYTLMMPSIRRLGLDPSDTDERKLLEKYLTFRTLSKLSTERRTVRDFWDYFEAFIRRFRGVKEANFFYYLKEAEWRFNRRNKPAPMQYPRHWEENGWL